MENLIAHFIGILFVTTCIRSTRKVKQLSSFDLEHYFFVGAQNTTTTNEEKPAAKLGSEAELCVDVDDSVLSDEALEKLDKELEKAEGKKPEVSCSGAAISVNGIDHE